MRLGRIVREWVNGYDGVDGERDIHVEVERAHIEAYWAEPKTNVRLGRVEGKSCGTDSWQGSEDENVSGLEAVGGQVGCCGGEWGLLLLTDDGAWEDQGCLETYKSCNPNRSSRTIFQTIPVWGQFRCRLRGACLTLLGLPSVEQSLRFVKMIS